MKWIQKYSYLKKYETLRKLSMCGPHECHILHHYATTWNLSHRPPAHRTKKRDHLHQLNPHKYESAMCYFHATFWKWELCCIISTNNRWNSRAAVKEQSWITRTSLLPSICFYDNRPDLHTKMCRYIKGSQRSIFTYILGWISLTRRGSEQTRHVYLK